MRIGIPRRPPGAMSIYEWCDLHQISVSMFYKMARDGWGPATIRIGRRQIITEEANKRWLAARRKEAA